VEENASRTDEEAEENTRFVKGWAGHFKSYRTRTPKSLSYIVDCLIFLFALYLGGAPTGNPDDLALAPGFGWLSPMIPRSWGFFMGYFYPDIGAIILVSILAHSNFLQKIFTTRIAQYLGDISLLLYMLHILVLHTLGNLLIVKCSATFGPLGSWGFPLGISSKFIHYDPKAN
jgi:hypothetical protein